MSEEIDIDTQRPLLKMKVINSMFYKNLNAPEFTDKTLLFVSVKGIFAGWAVTMEIHTKDKAEGVFHTSSEMFNRKFRPYLEVV